MKTATNGQLRGATRWAEGVTRLLDDHLARESAVVASYERFAGSDLPELPSYLVRLVVEDERRHHMLLAQMARAIGALSGEPGARSLLPSASEGAASARLMEESERFLAIERADDKELRRLLRALRVRPDHRLWEMLLSASDEESPNGEDPDAWQQAAQPLSADLLAEARMWQLLVRMQILDTNKHELILEFIRDWCTTRPEAPDD